MADCNDKSSASSMEKETYVENKYGGITPKKPLISKDHERAYFDSADWVLGKQAANGSARAAIESLKPKLKVSTEEASSDADAIDLTALHCKYLCQSFLVFCIVV
ncbi:hypothetical protein E2562_006891 [Oryza meyeriana var. granulata]|uniref:Negatively light-regulated protein n=1 Tax=Oryza meyeriana var. granulata TaxID=110450 RepID=A0A6G1BIZ3_9ORYZ|nr:hypothetical protein E2562_006891 [Oryza meyeriana var. granulata]